MCRYCEDSVPVIKARGFADGRGNETWIEITIFGRTPKVMQASRYKRNQRAGVLEIQFMAQKMIKFCPMCGKDYRQLEVEEDEEDYETR